MQIYIQMNVYVHICSLNYLWTLESDKTRFKCYLPTLNIDHVILDKTISLSIRFYKSINWGKTSNIYDYT